MGETVLLGVVPDQLGHFLVETDGRVILFNFVGRILGPRGMTAKQLEQETGCKIMVRGKGSMRDKKKEDANRGKPNWEHLADDLHVLLTVEDTENRAKLKLARAVEEVRRLLIPQADGEDELKKRQLMELAIINGTYRDSSAKAVVPVNADEEWRRVAAAAAETQRLLAPGGGVGLRTQAPLGAPLILSPRMSAGHGGQAGLLNGTGAGAAAGLLSPGEPSHQLIYASPYADYANYAALTAAANPLLTAEYATTDHTDDLCAYAARYGEASGSASASEGAPLPTHSLTGALIPVKTLSRRHFVHKVSANGAEGLTGAAAGARAAPPRNIIIGTSTTM
ncbi:hypothetical protein MSG28_008028 [Choristoneura fumiferana]|uniref:Uncharacterized protein n=1 Tax=Choristoneura fumiferana TaxID=7141 RepID=A0ACC0J9N6_CHOFU|nr:hypothetical protein MSG28_008028 [Choristoneura fumiferana]